MARGYDLNISAISPARTLLSTTPESCKKFDKILDMDQTSFDKTECEQKCEVGWAELCWEEGHHMEAELRLRLQTSNTVILRHMGSAGIRARCDKVLVPH